MPGAFVGRDGTKFVLDGETFPVVGVNCYFLAYCAAESARSSIATAQQMGANVIRTWAFADTADDSEGCVSFQHLKNGGIVFNDGPNGLERLDHVIQAADQLGVKLILPLVNHWKDFGGMPMYLQWFGIAGGVNSFYSSLEAREAYRNWVCHLLTRRNPLTGRLYSEEPSILGWELTNEARCEGNEALLLDWIHEMASFVKQLDNNHLLALGDEGFFKAGYFQHGKGQLYDGKHGCDFSAILHIPEIDFGGYHFYPQDWGHGQDLDFGETWIKDHAVVGKKANKPVLMEEYGLRVGDATVPDNAVRNQWYARWLAFVKETGTAGAMLWMLGGSDADCCGYKDDFVVYHPAEAAAVGDHSRDMGIAIGANDYPTSSS